ncbi:hypothetical protein AMECASPLE_015869 [Ameca splendens]|uniref:Uncharacterized protein n=1 Tax=Ameca splendens TaxID=208324 RepID=A0ABV0ZC47_9TELE
MFQGVLLKGEPHTRLNSFIASHRFSFRIAPLLSSFHIPTNSERPCLCRRLLFPQHDASTTMFHSENGMFKLIVLCCVVGTKQGLRPAGSKISTFTFTIIGSH